MIAPEKIDLLSTLALHAASGLSLGMSVTVLGDVLPWRWTDRHPWAVAALLIAVWMPLAANGIPEVRKAGATAVSLYLAGLFVAYNRKVAAAQAVPPAVALPLLVTAEHNCPVRLRGNCVPAPRIPVDDMIGRDPL